MKKPFTKIVFGIYFVLLCYLILFKLAFSFDCIPSMRSINLIPFGKSAVVNEHIDIKEIIYNILAFVPLGAFLKILIPKLKFWQTALICLCTSLLFEITQYIFAIGGSDITDLINNTLGGIIGIGYVNIFKNKLIAEKTTSIIVFVAEVIFIILFTLLFIGNM